MSFDVPGKIEIPPVDRGNERHLDVRLRTVACAVCGHEVVVNAEAQD